MGAGGPADATAGLAATGTARASRVVMVGLVAARVLVTGMTWGLPGAPQPAAYIPHSAWLNVIISPGFG